ncbi:hypothetical protein SODALDRAFT_351032 [Sodiomyces alkalinus F11]|uniref:Uncharacterized protein n=1 Tax=Sodiomyces alkalinus (strain CBS 110278 / VKM F-3762 / F11) TaxID=1314773 RepID=A0A3N2PTG3_SODAK|nr:hypothetical protein SODALDRAFT_351032 [Sodiomyces alkalinus F11]ROT37803.1 hypothetical protein SODALDRAFT_351032 [Sodiomyces alkalinus F11]
MSSTSQKQIAVAFYRRDPISTDPHKRKIYQHESYHWGILIVQQGNVHDAYEATDRNRLDPVTWKQENPTLDWWFKAKQGVNPYRSGKYLGCVVVGTVPADKSRDDVQAFLHEVPLPKRHQYPQQSCVTWVGNAIRALGEAQWMRELDWEEFADWALAYADKRLKNSEDTPEVVYYEK